ncbi:MAG: Cof-type HAD-IIB family hydrolase [Oscillospiraceae bacterium]|nr:Cof-type HAD-IIB family hydrolase [Oscillospiraceae bacterium]
MKYKLIASDMDGTLVNSKSELTQRTKDAIVSTVKAGALFVTATGRPFCNIKNVNSLFTEHQDMPFIVFNGAAAYMGKSELLLFERFLDFELAKEAFDIGQQLGIAQITWTGSRLWCNRICDETLKYRNFSDSPDLALTAVSDLADIKDEVPGFSKVLWIADPAEIKEHQVKMSAHFADKLNCFSSMAHFLEFVSPAAGKGSALAEVGKLFNIDSSEMIAVGDAFNDVSMLEYAGFSVAMDNAHDDIKAMCDYVTLSNDNDGVAAVIEKFIL